MRCQRERRAAPGRWSPGHGQCTDARDARSPANPAHGRPARGWMLNRRRREGMRPHRLQGYLHSRRLLCSLIQRCPPPTRSPPSSSPRRSPRSCRRWTSWSSTDSRRRARVGHHRRRPRRRGRATTCASRSHRLARPLRAPPPRRRHRAPRLGSTNGTWVEGVRLRDGEVPPGAIVRVGRRRSASRWARSRRSSTLERAASFGELVGASLEMRRLYAILERVAPTDATVLVEGETGHRQGRRRALAPRARRRARHGPFVAVDCGAIPENLVESELFGHVRGAFTGAVGDRPGSSRRRTAGTLFLDEIGEMPLALQPKLLRALETRAVRRVGGERRAPSTCAIVAATNRDLAQSRERRHVPRGPLLPARRRRGARCRRCARAATTSRLLARALPRRSRRRGAPSSAPEVVARLLMRAAGRATCASCATSSSAASRSRGPGEAVAARPARPPPPGVVASRPACPSRRHARPGSRASRASTFARPPRSGAT